MKGNRKDGYVEKEQNCLVRKARHKIKKNRKMKIVKTRETERGGYEENNRSTTKVVKRPEEEDKKKISETNKSSKKENLQKA